MKLCIMQPAYLPWPGYLDRIAKSDLFVVMDDTQFERGSLINRNKIGDQYGWRWLTVPVKLKGHTTSTIAETRIDNTHRWAESHLKKILDAYSRAPRFSENFKLLEQLYAHDTGNIADLCLFHLEELWLPQYGIKTPMVRMLRGLDDLHKTDLVVAICEHYGATEYISGLLGRNYLDFAKMKRAGIEVLFHDYNPPSYPQLWDNFISDLSILDMWMNTELNPWENQSSSLPHTLTMKHSDAVELSHPTLPEAIKSTS